MAEVVAVISIVANIIALIDISVEIYERTRDFSDGVKDVMPKAFRDVQARLPLIRSALQKTLERARSGEIGEDASKALKQTLAQCEENIKDLNDIFEKVLPKEGASRFKRGLQAVSSLGQDKKVEEINKAMLDHINVLSYFHSSEGATAMQVSEAFKSLTTKVEEAPRKPMFLVRYQKEEDFIGRRSIMEEIKKRFESGSRRVAIAGIGGVGKSRIAIEYCYQFRERNPDSDVFWVHGGTKDRMEAAYKEIAASMRIPNIDQPNVDIFKLVSDWLSEEKGSWLMVLDNADDAGIWTGGSSGSKLVPLANFLPRGTSHGSILITTRNVKIGKALTRKRPIEVPIFSSEDAIALLRSRIISDGEITDEDAKELTDSLDCLSLAVTQAASYLSENDMEVAEYLGLVKSSKSEISDLLTRDNYDDSRDPDIQNAVFHTWKISFDQIAQQVPRAIEVISLMSMLDREAVSADLLRYKDENELVFNEAIQTLKAYSLILEEATKKTYSMHRIIQMSIQWQLMKDDKMRYWQGKALACVETCFPKHGSYTKWHQIEALNPHAQVVLSYNFTEEYSQLQQARLMHVLGDYNSEHGLHDIAVQYLSHSLKIQERISSPPTTGILDSMTSLAFSLIELDRIEEAEAITRNALEISEKAFPGKQNGRILDNFATVMFRKGNFQEAELMFQQALAIRPDDNDFKHNYAITYNRDGYFEKAEILLREALADRVEKYGEEDPGTLTTMALLAEVLGNQNKFREQKDLLPKVFLLRKKLLGPSNPQTLEAMHDLASNLNSLGEFEEAQSLARDCLTLKTQVFGLEHKDTLITMNLIADIYDSMGRLTESYDLNKKTLELLKKVLGIENPTTVLTMYQLGLTLHKLQRYSEAEEIYKQTFKLEVKVLGDDHKDTLITMHNLANTLRELDKFEESEELFRKTVRLRTVVLGADHKDTLSSMYGFALVLYSLGKYEEAEKLERKTLESRIKVLGAEHSNTLTTMHNLASTLRELDKFEESEELFRKTVRLRTVVLGADHEDTLSSMYGLVLVLYSLEKYEETEKLERKTLELRTKVLGAEHKDTLLSMYNLVISLETLKKYKEAKELAEKCLELNISAYGLEHSETLDIQQVLATINSAIETKNVGATDVENKELRISDSATLKLAKGISTSEGDVLRETCASDDKDKAEATQVAVASEDEEELVPAV